jgi:hypothetical protein
MSAGDVMAEKGIVPYTEYTLENEEFIGTVDLDLEDTVEIFQDQGYEYQMLGAKKKHPERDEYDDGSFRLLDENNEKQWHVHFWEKDNCSATEIFSHYEYKPESWDISEGEVLELDRTSEHVLPDKGNYIPGQHSEEAKEIVQNYGEYTGNRDKIGGEKLQDSTGDIQDIFSFI